MPGKREIAGALVRFRDREAKAKREACSGSVAAWRLHHPCCSVEAFLVFSCRSLLFSYGEVEERDRYARPAEYLFCLSLSLSLYLALLWWKRG